MGLTRGREKMQVPGGQGTRSLTASEDAAPTAAVPELINRIALGESTLWVCDPGRHRRIHTCADAPLARRDIPDSL